MSPSSAYLWNVWLSYIERLRDGSFRIQSRLYTGPKRQGRLIEPSIHIELRDKVTYTCIIVYAYIENLAQRRILWYGHWYVKPIKLTLVDWRGSLHTSYPNPCWLSWSSTIRRCHSYLYTLRCFGLPLYYRVYLILIILIHNYTHYLS